MDQIATPPEDVVHRMSLLPSPLKSPMPAIVQPFAGWGSDIAGSESVRCPAMSHTDAAPVYPGRCQRMSDMPLPSRSYFARRAGGVASARVADCRVILPGSAVLPRSVKSDQRSVSVCPAEAAV